MGDSYGVKFEQLGPRGSSLRASRGLHGPTSGRHCALPGEGHAGVRLGDPLSTCRSVLGLVFTGLSDLLQGAKIRLRK